MSIAEARKIGCSWWQIKLNIGLVIDLLGILLRSAHFISGLFLDFKALLIIRGSGVQIDKNIAFKTAIKWTVFMLFIPVFNVI